MIKKKIALIYGLHGHTRDVNAHNSDDIYNSLKNDYTVQKFSFDKENLNFFITELLYFRPDLIFNNSCGKFSGDGTLESIFDLLGFNYIGSKAISTASCFDKKTTKRIVTSEGIKVIKDLTITKTDWYENRPSILNHIKNKLKYPIIVKATQGTDSIGIKVCRSETKAISALNRIFKEEESIMIEKFIKRKHEITCFILDNGNVLQPLDVVEYKFKDDILSQKLKSKLDIIETVIPAKIPDNLYKKTQKIAETCHKILGCRDYSRTDFLIDHDHQVYFLETNAHAGLSKFSASTLSAKAKHNWSHTEFIQQLISIAISRKN